MDDVSREAQVKPSSSLGTKLLFVFAVLAELATLPVWWVFIILSIPGSGASLSYWLMTGPSWAYPIMLLVAIISGINLLIKNTGAAFTILLLPPVIAFGYPFIFGYLFL